MDAYIYEASLYCEDCAPKGADGPYAEGGGEADTPQHCDACNVHLENPLTADGAAYVIEKILDFVGDGRGTPAVLAAWWDFYRDAIRDAWNGDDTDAMRDAVRDLLERSATDDRALRPERS